jgi:hypothetical protein
MKDFEGINIDKKFIDSTLKFLKYSSDKDGNGLDLE